MRRLTVAYPVQRAEAQNSTGMANFSHVSFVVSINNQKENKMKDHVELYWFLMEIFGSENAFMSTNWWRKSFLECWSNSMQGTFLLWLTKSRISINVLIISQLSCLRPLSLKITSTMPSKVIIMKWLSWIHLEAVRNSIFASKKGLSRRKSNWVIS